MATTTTTVTTGLVTGAGTALLPGLGLLALGGLALGVLALSQADNDDGGYGRRPQKGGYKYGGGHGGGGQGGYGHGRKRRSVKTKEEEKQLLSNEIEAIRKSDVAGCGLRMVCELGAFDEAELTEQELAILAFVGPDVVKPGEGLLPDSSLWEYQVSRVMGQVGTNCAKAFPACPYNATKLVTAINDLLP